MSRTRLADLAERTGLSESTVSRVINNKAGVAESTRQTVLTAMDVLGYERPSQLRPKAVSLIGLVTPELSNPIFPAFAQVIETQLVRHGFTPVLCTTTRGGLHEDDYGAMLLDRGVAGIIYVSGVHADVRMSTARYVTLRDRGLPIVMINGFREGVDAPFISNDDVASMELALHHLVQLGHRQIGLAVGPERYVPVIRKIEGFRASMRALLGETNVDRLIQTTMFTLEGGASAAGQLIERGATAVVCGSDLMALGAVREARSRGLGVPEDFSVVGYDDSPLMAFVDPPLTTVRQNVQSMGEAAVRALLDEVQGEGVTRGEFVFGPELVVRRSTAPLRALEDQRSPRRLNATRRSP